MKTITKDTLIGVSFILCLFATIIGVSYFIGDYIQDRIDASYKTGVIITTPKPEYLIELHYSDDTSKDILTIELPPRLLTTSRVVRYIYTSSRPMHLWHWILMYGDEEVYRETIDRNVDKGANIQFIYTVD